MSTTKKINFALGLINLGAFLIGLTMEPSWITLINLIVGVWMLTASLP